METSRATGTDFGPQGPHGANSRTNSRANSRANSRTNSRESSRANSRTNSRENSRVNSRSTGALFWPLGPLSSGVLAVGMTNLVSLIIIFVWVIQKVMEIKHFFIALILTCLLTFGLLVCNVCLLLGAARSKRGLVLPWLVVYAVLMLTLVVASAVLFHQMEELRPIAIVSIVFLVYFYFVVLAYYHELLLTEKQIQTDLEKGSELQPSSNNHFVKGQLVLIEEKEDSDDDEDRPDNCDDTFTNIRECSRNSIRKDNSNPFGSPVKGVGKEGRFQTSFLPQPDEVIFVESKEKLQTEQEQESSHLLESSVPLLTHNEQWPCPNVTKTPLQHRSSLSTSVEHQLQSKTKEEFINIFGSDSFTGNENGGGEQSRVSLSGSSTTPSSRGKNRSQSHSALLAIDAIDSSFTPFKNKNRNEQDMPKMKIFLPKCSDQDEDDEDQSSSSSRSSLASKEPLNKEQEI